MQEHGEVAGREQDAPATLLTAEHLDLLRTQADRSTSPFVDPAQLTRVSRFVTGRHAWATAILGAPFDLHRMTNRQMNLLDLAAQAEPEPPTPPRPPAPWEPGYVLSPAEQRDADRVAAADAEWARLQAAMPVPVSVAHNFSSRHHYEFYVQGADHIIVWAELRIGRLHRTARDSLCETPSRRRSLLFANAELERDGQEHKGERTLPTCRTCLRIARHIADATAVAAESRPGVDTTNALPDKENHHGDH
jgi:hypothetical protein